MSLIPSNVCLLGYSGHGLVVAEALRLCGISAIAYADKQAADNDPFGLTYAGFEHGATFPWEQFEYFALGMGDNALRVRVAQNVIQRGKKLYTVIHPNASAAADLKIAEGSFVARNVAINPVVQIGKYCIINTGAIIEHECLIGDGVHVAPGAVLAGNVQLADGVFVGANAVVKQGIRIGQNAVIGAGSVVLSDVPDNTTIVGNPGRKLK